MKKEDVDVRSLATEALFKVDGDVEGCLQLLVTNGEYSSCMLVGNPAKLFATLIYGCKQNPQLAQLIKMVAMTVDNPLMGGLFGGMMKPKDDSNDDF